MTQTQAQRKDSIAAATWSLRTGISKDKWIRKFTKGLTKEGWIKLHSTSPDDRGCVHWVGPTNKGRPYSSQGSGSWATMTTSVAALVVDAAGIPGIEAAHLCGDDGCIAKDHLVATTQRLNRAIEKWMALEIGRAHV